MPDAKALPPFQDLLDEHGSDVLGFLVATVGPRRLAVLGEMKELGPEAAAYHREIGRHARERGVELLIGVGELATEYGPDEHVADAEAAADALAAALGPGDAVLVKGSRAVGLERVAEKLARR